MTEMTREDLVEAIEEEQVKQTNRVLRWIILMVIGGWMLIGNLVMRKMIDMRI